MSKLKTKARTKFLGKNLTLGTLSLSMLLRPTFLHVSTFDYKIDLVKEAMPKFMTDFVIKDVNCKHVQKI